MTTSTQVRLSDLRDNFELYAQHVLRIPTKDRGLIPFTFNRAQMKVHHALEKQRAKGRPMRAMVLKSRQTGISTYVQARNFWCCHLRDRFQSLTLAHKNDSALHLFSMSRDHYERLTEMTNERSPLYAPRRNFTKRLIRFENTASVSQVEVVGEVRSYTCHALHLSEAAFYEKAKETFRSVKQAVPRRPETMVVVESTPNGFNEFKSMWSRAKSGKSSYAAVFIAWYDDDESFRVPADFTEKDLDEEEILLMKDHAVTLDQLAWRRQVIEDECDGDVDAFHQEYPSDDIGCFLASGRPAFDDKGLQFQLDNVIPEEELNRARAAEEAERTPIVGEIEYDADKKAPTIIALRRGRFRVYEDRIDRHLYCSGWDPSEGDRGSDFSPGVVIDRTNLHVAAVWSGRAPPDMLAHHAVNVCNYYNGAKMIWEANNHGVAFGITVGEIGYTNVYYRRVSEESVAKMVTDKPGYNASQKSRSTLVHTGRKYVRDQHAAVRDPNLVSEMTTFVFDGDKAEHQEGCYDDHLFALFMALFCHRGSADAPLQPLSVEKLERAYAEFGWQVRMKMRPETLHFSYGDGVETGVTIEDLEKYQQEMDDDAERRRKFGLGRFL